MTDSEGGEHAATTLTIVKADQPQDLPEWASREALQRFFNEKMQPWHDTYEDVGGGLDYAFSEESGKGGFLVAASFEGRLAGAVCMLRTGMKGYIPENLLLFIGVEPELRNQGIGRKLMERVIEECDGAIKLHVEADNPAKRLYERCGFEPKYVEMRYIP
jgi:GNAT superfamily N-acetyltransferase